LSKAVDLSKTDGEFRLFAAGWNGIIRLVSDGDTWDLVVEDGELRQVDSPGDGLPSRGDVLVLRGSTQTWASLLQSPPRPMFTDVFAAGFSGSFLVEPPPVDAQRHNAVRRLGELLRHAANDTDPAPKTATNVGRHGAFDQAVGRYIHLELEGVEHRVYY